MEKLKNRAKRIKHLIKTDERFIKKLILSNVLACTVFTTGMAISAFSTIDSIEKHLDLQQQKENATEISQTLNDEITETRKRMIAGMIATSTTSALTLATFNPALRLTVNLQELREKQKEMEI